jgi:hypothetical protein
MGQTDKRLASEFEHSSIKAACQRSQQGGDASLAMDIHLSGWQCPLATRVHACKCTIDFRIVCAVPRHVALLNWRRALATNHALPSLLKGSTDRGVNA